jgi:hypothetical protein
MEFLQKNYLIFWQYLFHKIDSNLDLHIVNIFCIQNGQIIGYFDSKYTSYSTNNDPYKSYVLRMLSK